MRIGASDCLGPGVNVAAKAARQRRDRNVVRADDVAAKRLDRIIAQHAGVDGGVGAADHVPNVLGVVYVADQVFVGRRKLIGGGTCVAGRYRPAYIGNLA